MTHPHRDSLHSQTSAFEKGSDSHERIVTSSLPMSRESVRTVIDATTLDRLFVACCAMPIERGETAVMEFLGKSLAEILPTFGIGACLVPMPVSTSTPNLSAGPSSGQRVFKHVPDDKQGRVEGMDPTRLFPGFAFEKIFEVEPHGTTLHIASDEDVDDAAQLHLMQRAALAMSRGLALARDHEKAKGDARELRALSSHMVQAEKLASLGQIAAGVVHELNNPLTSIVAYTDWLIRKTGPQGDLDSLERLRRIGDSAGRILRFTRDLVTYARPSSEVPVAVSLHHVIDQALAFCEHVLAEHGAKVKRHFDLQIPAVRGMPEQLVQVFVNLFTNACHAMPADGGELTVSSELDPSKTRVIVCVEDNGHGIGESHLAQIFAPFFTTKVDGRGTGLGLSIVKNIMANHTAEIRAEQAEMGGARFVLVFPAS